MKRNPALRKISSVLSYGRAEPADRVERVLLLAFVFGVLFGFFVGVYSGPAGLEPASAGGSDSLGSAWLFFALLLIFSTSYLGLVLIPLLIFVRGCIFSCSVAVLWLSMDTIGILISLLGSALPLCSLLPCYIRVGGDCFLLSRKLACLRMDGHYAGAAAFPLRHFLVLLLMIVLDSFYSSYVLPVLTGSLISGSV